MQSDQLESFLADLQAQLGLYNEITLLNKQQMTLLDEPSKANPDDLLDLVGRKQSLMAELQELEGRVRPLRDQWQAARAGLPSEVRDFADNLLDQLAATIKTLIELEDVAHKKLESLMAQAQQGIDTIRKKSQVNRAYAAYGKAPAQPRFVDKRTGDQ